MINRTETAPPTKKRKVVANNVAADENEVVPIDDDEVSGDDNETAELEDDGVEEVEDSAAEDAVGGSGPTSKAAEIKGGVVPEEDDLDEVAVGEDEDDE